jgi:hypothetical protein
VLGRHLVRDYAHTRRPAGHETPALALP